MAINEVYRCHLLIALHFFDLYYVGASCYAYIYDVQLCIPLGF